MPRKTNGNGTPSRRKKAVASIVEPPPGQFVPEVRKSAKKRDLDEEIRCRAYEIYLEPHGVAGDEHQDWLLAEREVRERRQQGYSV